MLCWDENDEDMYLMGSFESKNINRTHTALELVIDRCRNANFCASDEDIEEFVYDKIFSINYLDNKPNFDSFEHFVNQ